jgi:hypothetical protein
MAAKRAEAAKAGEAATLDLSGQITVTLGGQDYRLRPSWEAIIEVEQALRPLFSLATDASRGVLTIPDMATLVAAFMRAEGKRMGDKAPQVSTYRNANEEKLSKLIFEQGAPSVCARLMVLLVGALNGGYTAEGEAKTPPDKGTPGGV